MEMPVTGTVRGTGPALFGAEHPGRRGQRAAPTRAVVRAAVRPTRIEIAVRVPSTRRSATAEESIAGVFCDRCAPGCSATTSTTSRCASALQRYHLEPANSRPTTVARRGRVRTPRTVHRSVLAHPPPARPRRRRNPELESDSALEYLLRFLRASTARRGGLPARFLDHLSGHVAPLRRGVARPYGGARGLALLAVPVARPSRRARAIVSAVLDRRLAIAAVVVPHAGDDFRLRARPV